jgi:PAS domain S-box-containing protein
MSPNRAHEARLKEFERLVEERTAELTAANQEVLHVNAELQRQLAEKTRAQEALSESEERLRTICDSTLDAVVMIDAEGRVVFWNPAAEEMFGYGGREIVGQLVHQILAPSYLRERANLSFQRFTKHGRGRAVGRLMRLEAVRKDGTTFPVELSISGFQREGQWWASAIIRDVTQRKRAEKALEEYAIALEQRSTELAHINARLAREIEARRRAYRAVKLEQRRLRRLLELHDSQRHLIGYEIHDGLAQQLAAVKMHWETFGRLYGTGDAQSELAYQKGLELVQQSIVETRRLISGLRPPVLDECGVMSALRDFLERIEASRRATIEISTDLDDHERFEPLVENAVFRVVQEGVNNALHHGKGDRIRVCLRRLDDRLHIEVQDWGIGFAPKDVRQGAFGLEGIRQRARLAGGHASVTSEPGKGTLVTVELPLVSDSRRESAAARPQ